MYQVFEPLRIINPTANIYSLLSGLEQFAHALSALADYEDIFDYMLVHSRIRAFDKDTIERWKSYVQTKEIPMFKEQYF